jgi:DNA-directed RNA polymerase specialized sigma24 family protein
MADPETPDPKREHHIDWDQTRRQIRDRIQAQVGQDDPAIDDLTQQALIELLRVVRRDGASRLPGLIAVVARTTAIDEIRRRRRSRARSFDWKSSLDRIEGLPDPGENSWSDSAELLWFLLLEFMRERQAPCHDLALRYAEKGDWKTVAEESGKGYDAIRQQWSRCVRAFRKALRRDPGPFKDWLDDA